MKDVILANYKTKHEKHSNLRFDSDFLLPSPFGTSFLPFG
jgi:hypothetical protein